MDKYLTKYANYPKPYNMYGTAQITVSGGISDWSLRDNSSIFSSLSIAYELLITVKGSGGFDIKFNETTYPLHSLESGDNFRIQGLNIEDIFLTNSGADTEASFFILGWV